MEYTNKHGIKFFQYIESRIWVTRITYKNMEFKYSNSMDYYPHLETLTPEMFEKFAAKTTPIEKVDTSDKKQNEIIEIEKKGEEATLQKLEELQKLEKRKPTEKEIIKQILYEGELITEEEYKEIIDKDLEMDIIKKGKIVKKNETVEEPVEPKKKTTKKTTRKK